MHFRTKEKRTHPWPPVTRQRNTAPTAGEKASAPDSATTSAQAGLSGALGRSSDTRHGVAEAMFLPTARNNHSGESLDVGAFRESLERIQKEIGYCLKGLAMVESGGMGRAFSRPKSRARVVSAMGFKVPRPKSKFRALSKSAQDIKGKGPLVCPADRPKMLKAKVGPGSRPPFGFFGLRCIAFSGSVATGPRRQDLHTKRLFLKAGTISGPSRR
jgi:hypothetical protein